MSDSAIELLQKVSDLVGPVAPSGNAEIDEQRLANLAMMTELVDHLLNQIREVESHKATPAGEAAANYLGSLLP